MVSVFQSHESTSPPRLIVELCAGGIEDVELAARLGVDRIELNCGMAVGGLTPSAALASLACRTFDGPIVGMLRPREGGFAYSASEFCQMVTEAESIVSAGVKGLAVGFLTSDGEVDETRCRRIRELFPASTLVFHKAFDATQDLDESLEQIIDCGFNRVLTSGGKATAQEGSSTLARLIRKARGRIEIIPGGGIRSNNVEALLIDSGCSQIHSAVREVCVDSSMQKSSSLHFGLPGESNGSFGRASEDQLKALLNAVSHRRLP